MSSEIVWRPEPIWRGETCFILGGGPSLTAEIADRLRNWRTIAINCSAPLAPWADVLLFMDDDWFQGRRAFVAGWAGMVVTTSHHSHRQMPEKIRLIETENDGIPPVGWPRVRKGPSTGHTAVGLSVALGVSCAVLLGFDMQTVEGREHHHNEYIGKKRNLAVYADEYIPAFRGWNEQALARGVTILNATPNSALKEFPFVDLDEFLRAGAGARGPS